MLNVKITDFRFLKVLMYIQLVVGNIIILIRIFFVRKKNQAILIYMKTIKSLNVL